MSGSVISIFIASDYEGDTQQHDTARLDAGKGIVGDRYYGEDVDAQVTLIDADTVDAVNAKTGWKITPQETRRNIVTRGVDLNQWETGRFRVGDAILEGVELCEPCSNLGAILENDDRTAADVVKALTHLAGLRARVVNGADINSGDPVASE